MTGSRVRWLSVFLVWFGLLMSPLSRSGASISTPSLPPNPYDILASQDLETPVLDAVSFCEPEGLRAAADPILDRARAGEWENARELLTGWMTQLDHPTLPLQILDAVLLARAAQDREQWVSTEEFLRGKLREPEFRAAGYCLRAELARILLLLERESESAAQWTLAERLARAGGFEERVADPIAFGRAEILYRTGRRFDAHLGFREVAKSKNPRLAAAARLRLTDLSFDSGNVDRVSIEYETLLPRAPAYGGSMQGWALRAAEAALDGGHMERGGRWIERYLASNPARDGRDAAEIRLADLDAMAGDPLAARKRLSAVSGRHRDDRLGALAAIRSIDLGVFEGSPKQRVEVLKRALRKQRRGVRRYALAVLMNELEVQGDLEGALTVATRLAYAGVDPVVAPTFEEDLDRLLTRATSDAETTDCELVIRALGGRYGILIERSEKTGPFKRVGLCFEEIELPWLAANVYRSMTRRFGTRGASAIALPLARSSLAIGEITLARRMALAALNEPGPDDSNWQAILAEADFRDGRLSEAARGLRSVLDSEKTPFEHAKLVRLFALSLGELSDRKKMKASGLMFLSKSIPVWLSDREWPPAARAALIEAALLTAHSQRSLGRNEQALALYRTVEEFSDPGVLQSSARFWLGRAELQANDASSIWGRQPNERLRQPWGRLAQFEHDFSSLGNAYSGSAP